MGSDGVREILGRKRTVEILEYLSDRGARNYSEVENALDTSSDTLSDSLDLLGNHGLVERNERTKKDVRYEITRKGDQFLREVQELEEILSEDTN